MNEQLATSQTTRPQAAPVPARRRRRTRGAGVYNKPGFVSYAILVLAIVGFSYPLWWSFVVASGTNATRGETLPFIPGPNFMALSLIHISEPTRLGMISY